MNLGIIILEPDTCNQLLMEASDDMVLVSIQEADATKRITVPLDELTRAIAALNAGAP